MIIRTAAMNNKINIKEMIICPVCGASFESDGKSLICCGEKHHLFDFASSGYVNLLPPGKGKNSKSGDDAEMMAARKRFLASGCYDRISVTIGEIISSLAKDKRESGICVVDSGSGEGRHTCNIIKTVAENGIPALAIGFDASKKGAALASSLAKRETIANPYFCDGTHNLSAFFAAGNIFSLPVRDHSADFVTSLFAPIAGEENKRILRQDGCLVVAASGAHHLVELRKVLYDEVRLSSGEIRCPEGFYKVSEQTLCYKTIVENNALIRDLFTMTPFYYRTSLSDKAKLDKIDRLEITVEVLVGVFSPKKQ